jgi:hypothetical protein
MGDSDAVVHGANGVVRGADGGPGRDSPADRRFDRTHEPVI